jgi:inner membrane protein involved in colicin E2 resistance
MERVANPTVDLIALAVTAIVMVFVFWTAVTTRSNVMRFVLITIALMMAALMVWNLSTHGGYHAV